MALFDFNKKQIENTIKDDTFIASIKQELINIPSMRESVNSKWINYGEDNLYPQYLVEMTKRSALHRTLIDNKSKLIAGTNINVNDIPLDQWITNLNGNQSLRLNNLFYNKKYPLRDWVKRTAYDYSVFGSFTTEVIWDSNFEFIKVMKHIDTSKIRSGVMNSNGEIENYFYSREWNRWNTKDMVKVSTFDPDNDKYMNQIIYKKDYYPSLDYYTEPPYIGGLTYINLDAELGLFNLSHIQNGFNPGLIFKVPYNPKSIEEKQKMIQQLMEHYKGARNANNPIILFKNGEATWEVDKVEVQGLDTQLIALGDFILQQLLFAHKVTNGALVGLLVPGKLGNTNSEELKYSTEQFMKFVIEPAREMLEEVLEEILLTYGLDVKIKIV